MKTIEEKARAYDEAIKRAKAFELAEYKNIMESVFPELVESEDEKIRKEFCKDIWTFIPNEKAHKYIAWLEKQGKWKLAWSEEDKENMNNILYILNQLKDTSSYEEDDIAEKTINWFKSLKDRLYSSNQYDKDMLGAIVYCIKNNRQLEKEHINWLEKNKISISKR